MTTLLHCVLYILGVVVVALGMWWVIGLEEDPPAFL